MLGFYRKHPKFDTTRLYKRRGKIMYKKRGKEMRRQGLLAGKSIRRYPKIKYLKDRFDKSVLSKKYKSVRRLIMKLRTLRIERRKSDITLSNKKDELEDKEKEIHNNLLHLKHKLFRISLGHLIRRGRKGWAEKTFSELFFVLKERFQKNPEGLIYDAFERLRPVLGLRPKKRGGVIYRVPYLLKESKQHSMAVFWLISHAKLRARSNVSLAQALADEITDVLSNVDQGSLKKKQELHRTALANRPFLS